MPKDETINPDPLAGSGSERNRERRALIIAAAADRFVRVMNDVEETITTRAARRREQQAAYDALVDAIYADATEKEAIRATDS